MAKFGELIDLDIPVLISFYKTQDNQLEDVLNTVASEFRQHAKVVKINTGENHKLTEALKIRSLPTFVIYKNGEMVWRKVGMQSAETLSSLINRYK